MHRKLVSVVVALLTVTAWRATSAATPVAPDPPPDLASAFFDDSTVHEIRLAVNSRDWQTLKSDYLENTYFPADFRWNGEVVRNVGIRSRGTGSRSGVKPGLRVDIDRYSQNQEFLGLKSFVLRNNTQDPSNMHERLSMMLFRRLGFPAPREAYARLYVNNEYAGLYTIVESIDKKFLKRNYGEDEGYLFKYDYPVGAEPYYFSYLGSTPELYVPLPFKPETHEADSRPEFIERLIWTINESTEAGFRMEIAEYLDLDQFVRHVAVENFLADLDGILGRYAMNNFYFYRFQNQKRFTFIAWDKSEAFKGGTEYRVLHNISDVPSWFQNRLMTRSMRSPDLYNRYLGTLLECAQSVMEREAGSPDDRGWLAREIDREYEQIRDAALADPMKPFSNEEFATAVEDLRAFAVNRAAFVVEDVTRAQPPQ